MIPSSNNIPAYITSNEYLDLQKRSTYALRSEIACILVEQVSYNQLSGYDATYVEGPSDY